MLTAPELLLLDEPLASLDIPRKRELLPYLQRLAREINIPMLYVSHSLDEILHRRIKSWCWRMDRLKRLARWKKSGKQRYAPVAAERATEQYSESQRAGASPALCHDRPALGDQHLWVNKLNQPLQSTLRIRIQASDVSLVLQPPQQTSIRNVLRAKVANCYDDNGQEVQLEIGGRTLWARISPWAWMS